MPILGSFAAMSARGFGFGVAQPDYFPNRSLRFRSNNSAYMSLTPAAGTQDRFKIRVDHKRSGLGSKQVIIGAGSSSPDLIYFDSSDRICWDFAGTTRLVSNAVFRDTRAWGTWEFIYDAGNATASLRARVFYEGVEITSWGTDTRSSITTGTSKINTNVVHNIGRDPAAGTSYISGYLSDAALINNDSDSGFSGGLVNSIWALKPAIGAKWWLKMSDNSSSSTLGNDSGSDATAWTTSGFSVTAGVTNDSLVDTPANYGTDTGAGGEVRGNYATLDAISPAGSLPGSGAATLASGNLVASAVGAGAGYGAAANMAFQSSQYAEFTITGGDTQQNLWVGVSPIASAAAPYVVYGANGAYYDNGSWSSAGAWSTFTTGDIIGVAWNSSTGAVSFYKNGVLQGTLSAPSSLSSPSTYAMDVFYTSTAASIACNFGQRPFAYAAPSGFKAFCTQNFTNTTITTSGTFTGNANASGPVVYLNGVPTSMTINGNAVTFGTHADKLSTGFKIRTSSSSYNTNGSNSFSVTATGAATKVARAQVNP
ncbi:MAG TPA: hypothetical protein VNR39_12155 [Pseudolabrys sp.]|nr:hypothetical protein [Pseudolabrys sp.]